MSINGVHHISLSTGNLDRLLAFYRDLLGLSQRHVSKMPETEALQNIVGLKDIRGRVASLRVGNVQIEFFEYHNPVPQALGRRPACDEGIRHIAFDVTDIWSEYNRLRAAGVEFVSEPQDLGAAGGCSVYGYDPDGNIFEFQEIFENSMMERVPLPPRV